MNIEIKGVRDSGKKSDERLVLSVLKDDDIGNYVVFDTTYTVDNKVSNKVRHTYWFPDKSVKSGDLVVLYTKNGNQSETKNNDGSTTHFFHWGLDITVWNDGGDCAVVLEARNWTVKRVE